MFKAALTGYLGALSLTLPLAAQGTLVLRQGLLRRRLLVLCAFLAVSDAILIVAGVAAANPLIAAIPRLRETVRWAAAAFLTGYGVLRLLACRRHGSSTGSPDPAHAPGTLLATAAAVTWANPHVHLHLVGFLGALSVQFSGSARTAFALGAIAGPPTIFLALGYGARLIAPATAGPRAWRLLDGAIGVLMLAVAAFIVTFG